MLTDTKNATYDALTVLKDAGAVTSSGAAQVGGSNRTVDLGGAGSPGMAKSGQMVAEAVIDVTAFSGTNPLAVLHVQGSNDNFASEVVNLGSIEIASGTGKTAASSLDATPGRYILPFTNWRDGITYQYVRMYHAITGTVSINYTSRIAKLQGA